MLPLLSITTIVVTAAVIIIGEHLLLLLIPFFLFFLPFFLSFLSRQPPISLFLTKEYIPIIIFILIFQSNVK
uniref:Uncharacterized protein n=1 Tax=Nelumbo nucifera TaxID=4432 RepID=A0A822YS87_NELNU|nr:TPA_asm: hypothetical protein HUJ06_012766 [Nelumbo nucifera]